MPVGWRVPGNHDKRARVDGRGAGGTPAPRLQCRQLRAAWKPEGAVVARTLRQLLHGEVLRSVEVRRPRIAELRSAQPRFASALGGRCAQPSLSECMRRFLYMSVKMRRAPVFQNVKASASSILLIPLRL